MIFNICTFDGSNPYKSQLMVALILVCESLGNSLNVGLLNIIDYTLDTLPQVSYYKVPDIVLVFTLSTLYH